MLDYTYNNKLRLIYKICIWFDMKTILVIFCIIMKVLYKKHLFFIITDVDMSYIFVYKIEQTIFFFEIGLNFYEDALGLFWWYENNLNLFSALLWYYVAFEKTLEWHFASVMVCMLDSVSIMYINFWFCLLDFTFFLCW